MAKLVAMDGNAAVAHVAHATNEVIAIYPITPSSNMGEICDAKSAKGETNIWGNIPVVSELQSEAGAVGSVHGALSAGALTTTFTASQGLLLMIPNMFKIAGELTPTVFHVSARAIATHALSIFGDHSDVMAVRQTGWAMLASANCQEAMDFAMISAAATFEARVPFLHFFDGFRTSHELNMVEPLTKEQMASMVDPKFVADHRARAVDPEKPTIRGTAQNPDVYFQGREAVNKFYEATPAIVKKYMAQFAKMTGREYDLFEYEGDADAERLIVIMASGADVAHTAVECLKGTKIGILKIRLFRPFSIADFVNKIPKTVKKIAVMDRTKEPGSLGEPLFQDVCSAFLTDEGRAAFPVTPLIIGGRYGIGSKEFTPGMVKAVFDNLAAVQPKKDFVVGINDDLTGKSLTAGIKCDSLATSDSYEALFFGLGSDGTVGANKNTMKIISEKTDNFSQGYFVYDSKKAGSMTTSHIRFGKQYIRAPYLIESADFIGAHVFSFLEKYDLLSKAKPGATLLINAPYAADKVWEHLPVEVQKQIVDKKLKLYAIDASEIALKTGMGARTNTIMQTAFFGISGIIETNKAIEAIKEAIKKTYSKKGDEIVQKNYGAVDAALAGVHEIKYDAVTSKINMKPAVPSSAPKMVKEVLGEMIAFRGEDLPTSAMPEGGVFPTGTTQYEKRNIAVMCPEWDKDLCIQCGICSMVCPHAAIRIKAYEADALNGAPASFKSADGKADLAGKKVTVQVAVEDCTGCGACVVNCPAKSKDDANKKAINMVHQLPLRDTEVDNFAFFLGIKSADVKTKKESVKGSQLQTPLFEFSGACAGCGETPYVKLLTQLFGDRLAIANATGCSSIYGGNLPTTPYCKRADGRGPAWANSLFEDNAEFGLGMRLAYDQLFSDAKAQLKATPSVDAALVEEILNAPQGTTQEVDAQRARIDSLKAVLGKASDEASKRMLSLADYLIKKSVWILGGDGWAYDIGYGGLDHVLASGKNVKIMVMDTEVYSNTGGQMSKATPMGATALFAAGGKVQPKKDLGMISMTYGNIYVAQVALGANMNQVVQAMAEAEAFDGPAIIIAYSHCIAHGIDMSKGLNEAKKAVNSGRWILYRFNPELKATGNPLKIDSGAPTITVEEFMNGENRFKSLAKQNPELAAKLAKAASAEYDWRRSVYEQLSKMSCDVKKADA